MNKAQEFWNKLMDAQRDHGVGSPEAKRAQAAYRRELTAARRRREKEAGS